MFKTLQNEVNAALVVADRYLGILYIHRALRSS